jgi:hypothetical protein
MGKDGHLPHKFPKLDKNDSYDSILVWECQACGKWIKEYGNEKKTDCTIDWRELKMGKREKVMKEPPMGSVVIDTCGSAWQRHPRGWSISGSDGSWWYSWERVIAEDLYRNMESPSPEWSPVLNDPRLPLIVYVPHEELLTDSEED